MAQFYGDLQGNRGGTSRMGSKASGIEAHARGWDVGIQVHIDHVDGEDICTVTLTSGSNGTKQSKHIGQYKASDLD